MALTHPVPRAEPIFSIPSILAIVAAIGSLFAGPGLGLILAILAVILGAIGVLAAFAPGVRGGVTSMTSIVLGAIGIIVAILKFLF